MKTRILIIGASIAGQTLAYWLARYGFQPTVAERASGLRSGGNGVDVRDHAVEVVKRMGILSRVQALATDVQGISFVNDKNQPVARVDIQKMQRQQAKGELEIMRGDLVTILHDLTKNAVEHLFGDSVTQLEQQHDGVLVTFEQATPRHFDLVIGADGLHSTVRQLAFGPESNFLRYKGYYFAFGHANSDLGENRWMTMYNLPGKMAGIYRSGNHAEAKSYFVFRQPEQLRYDYRDSNQQKDLLREAFAHETSWRVQELLADALADPNLYFDSVSQVQMPSWHIGRIALVGDAAYCASPASGGGAALALIGAYRLAGELAAANGAHEVAFPAYHAGMQEIVKNMQQIGPQISLMAPKTRVGIWVRNIISRIPLLEAMSGMERIMQGKDSKPLPDCGGSLSLSTQE